MVTIDISSDDKLVIGRNVATIVRYDDGIETTVTERRRETGKPGGALPPPTKLADILVRAVDDYANKIVDGVEGVGPTEVPVRVGQAVDGIRLQIGRRAGQPSLISQEDMVRNLALALASHDVLTNDVTGLPGTEAILSGTEVRMAVAGRIVARLAGDDKGPARRISDERIAHLADPEAAKDNRGSDDRQSYGQPDSSPSRELISDGAQLGRGSRPAEGIGL